MGCFNTQPPKGGWAFAATNKGRKKSFNTQPPKGGWTGLYGGSTDVALFQHTAA